MNQSKRQTSNEFCFSYITNGGSYNSANVLLNLLNELGKRDKMRGLSSILSIFRNELNTFNNTRARLSDSIYHMTNTLESHFWRKNAILLSLCTQRCYGRHNVSRKSKTTSGLSILLCGVISLPDGTSCDNCSYHIFGTLFAAITQILHMR